MRRGFVPLLIAAAATGVIGHASASDQRIAQVPPMLVFERGGDIYRMSVDGAETVRLTRTKVTEGDPAVAPDRLRIAYVRGGDEVWLMNLDGAGQTLVLPARPQPVRSARTGSPAWSPDGLALFASRSALGPEGICGSVFRVGADGRDLRRVTRPGELHSQPAVSPDGRRIAFIAGECEPGRSCCRARVVDRAGRPTNDLRKLSGRFLYKDVTWSPDGSRVALEASIDDGPRAVFVANRDGSGLRRVTPRSLSAEAPAWSPDGDLIAFAAGTPSSASDLYAVHPDGTGLQQLTRTRANERSPAWLLRT